MKKDKLLKEIQEAINKEEKVIPIYSKHLDALTDLSSLNEENKNRLENIFQKMKADSKDHNDRLEKIKEKIKEEDKSEY